MSMRLLVMLLVAGLVVVIGAGVMLWMVPTSGNAGLDPAGNSASAAAMRTALDAVVIPEVVVPADLDKLISDHHGPVLLDFHADWCEPCKALHPTLVRLAVARPDIQVVGVDVVKAEALAQRYGVGDLPLLVLVSGGEECARHVGDPELAALRAWVALALAAKAVSATAAAAVTAPGSATAAAPADPSAATPATTASP